MHKGVVTFLFDSREFFQESWDMIAPGSAEALDRLKRIATARLPLLGSNVQIVQLKVVGERLVRVQWRGAAPFFAWPRQAVNLRNDGWAMGKRLRGVPRELCAGWSLTPQGLNALNNLSRVLRECGGVVVRQSGESLSITNLQAMSAVNPLSWKFGKKASLRQLVSLLGEESAQQVWERSKKQKV